MSREGSGQWAGLPGHAIEGVQGLRPGGGMLDRRPSEVSSSSFPREARNLHF